MDFSDLRVTKFFPPRKPPDFVLRERLISMLDKGSRYPLTLVSAPAGYGKSTLVTTWLSDCSKHFAWISLSGSENNLIDFIWHVMGSISKASNYSFENTSNMLRLSESPPPESIYVTFLNDLAEFDKDTILILDDFHLIHETQVHHLVKLLISNPIPGFTLLIITRQDTLLPVDEWRSKSLLFEIRTNDLQFNQNEILELLRAHQIKSNLEESAQKLLKVSEGWAAGLRLILHNVASAEMLGQRLDDKISGRIQNIFQFAFEKLEKSYPEKLKLLELASLFDQISGELLAFVASGKIDLVDIDKMESLLSEIARDHALVIPLGDDNKWYRFHHLLQDHLKQRLYDSMSGENVKEYHYNAAVWYSSKKYLSYAITHFIYAEQQDSAIQLFDHFRWKLLDNQDWQQLGSLLDKFGNHPEIELKLAKCWNLIYQARVFEFFELLPEIGNEISQVKYAQRRKKLQAEFQALHPYFLYNVNQHEASIDSSEAAIASLESHQSYALGYAYIFLIGSLQATGKYQEAVSRFRTAVQNNHLRNLKSHLLLVLNYIHWLETEISELITASQELIDSGIESDNKEAIANGNHFLGLALFSQGKNNEAISAFAASFRYRSSTIGVIHIMNSISYIHALIYNEQLQEARDVMNELKKYTRLKTNDYFTHILHYVELEFLMAEKDLNSIHIFIEKLPEVPLINYSNFYIPRLSLIKSLLLIRKDARARKEIDVLTERFKTTFNLSGSHRLKPFELELDRRAGKPWKKAFVDWMLVTRSKHLEGMIPYAEEFVIPMARETGLDLPEIIQAHRELYGELSKRELEISQILYLSNKEISEKLFISDRTVKSHVNSIFRKLNVSSREEVLGLLKITN